MKLSEAVQQELFDTGRAPAPPVKIVPVGGIPDDMKPDLAKLWMEVVRAGLPAPVPEFRFHETRKFRFDLAWPSLKVAVEREGGTWGIGRHNSGSGMSKDAEKYNLAAIGGWLVIRATVDMLRDGKAIEHAIRAIEVRIETPTGEAG